MSAPRVLLLLVLAFAALTAAAQQPADDFRACETESGDIGIAACDRVIASGRYSGKELSEAYNNRGYELERQKKHERALADYNTSVGLDPNHTFAYNNRGNVRFTLGDVDGSIADYSAAIRLNPDYAIAYTNRGLSYEDKGDKARAIADFRAALGKPDKYGSTASAKTTARQRLRAMGQ
jgi:tetratricopeptide (TPR) repeat protein